MAPPSQTKPQVVSIEHNTPTVDSPGPGMVFPELYTGQVVKAPRLCALQPSNGLTSWTSTLTGYYFKEVAGLFSCFDGALNPFRTIVARACISSPAMLRTLQSMAGACLDDDLPHLKTLTHQLRAEAVALLNTEPEHGLESLLTLLMIGQTSSWFDARDLGIPHLIALKVRLREIGTHVCLLEAEQQEVFSFLQEALVYWEMLLSFVGADFGEDVSDRRPVSWYGLHSHALPHPWTGVCGEIQLLVHDVGRLVRQERLQMCCTSWFGQRSVDEAEKAFRVAQQLERQLIGFPRPLDEFVSTTGDVDTPVWHLYALSEAWRYTGLLNLYKAFPQLLESRYLCESQAQCLQDMFCSWISPARPDEPEDGGADAWLLDLALGVLDLIESIPVTSRTKGQHPIILVSCANQLCLSIDKEEPETEAAHQAPPPFFNVNAESGDDCAETTLPSRQLSILSARKLVKGRLVLLRHVLPSGPIDTCLEIVQRVWDHLDAGDSHIHWIDSMIQYGLHTTMG
ncbi:hypothetical protein H2204_014720 [Knufia peltigerae]|uniref:Uncharacterized protein n=1 Tax=Knufia peltigerae TaxID=1002370 RepID=A0AA38XHW0_9EURO|nr:hypothetical protein H2204_014720 [Knufia peltigerae]